MIPNNYELFELISSELNRTPRYFEPQDQVVIGPVYYNTVSCQGRYEGYWQINQTIIGIEITRGNLEATRLVQGSEARTYYTKNKITIDLANPKFFEILQKLDDDWIWLKHGQDPNFPDSILFHKHNNKTTATPIYHLTNNLPPATPVLEEENATQTPKITNSQNNH